MPNSLDPRIRQWYRHLDKGQPFFVTALGVGYRFYDPS